MWRFSQERFLIIDKIKLYNGVEIPQVGLGTWLMNNEQVYENEKELNALKQIKLDIRWYINLIMTFLWKVVK